MGRRKKPEVQCQPLNAAWAEHLKKSAWWCCANIDNPEMFLRVWPADRLGEREMLLSRWEKFRELHSVLLAIGGYETCFADAYEEDMDNILSRGQFYPGKSRMMLGKPSRCHENVCNLYMANKDKLDVRIATGYALSEDGCWRQHSWLVHSYETQTQHRTRVIETTAKRVAYYGFEMTQQEAQDFCYYNYF